MYVLKVKVISLPYIFLVFHYYLLSLQLDVVPCGGRKKSPALIYSADNIFLLVLRDHGIYSKSSKLIIGLDSYSKKIEIFWYFSTYISL